MRKAKFIIVIALLISVITAGACVPAVSPTVSPTQSPSLSPSASTAPSASTPIIIVPSDDVFRPESQAHLYDLLNFADPESIRLFSLGSNGYKGVSWEEGYMSTYTGQYQLVDDPKAKDGKAVEITISSPTDDRPYRDLVLIDVSAAGLYLDEIGEIYIDFMFVDGEQLNDWWPRVTLNENLSGEFDCNTVQSWRADGMVKYASERGDNSYAAITHEEIVAHYGISLKADDMLHYIGFQFYAYYTQHATIRIDSITIKTVYEL